MNAFDPKNNSQLKATIPYIRKVYTSLFASLSAMLFSFIILNAYMGSYLKYEADFTGNAERIFLIILFPIIIIVTSWLVFNYFDNLDLFNKRDYIEKRKFDKKIKPLISEKHYLVGFAIEMLFSVAIFSTSYDIMLCYFFPKLDVVVARLLSVVTMAILRLLQLWSLQDKWETEITHPFFVEKAIFKRNRDYYAFKPRQMIWQPIGFVIIFSLAASFATNYGFIIFLSLFYILISPDMWWAIFSLPIIIIAVTYVTRFIHNTKKRAILIKKLKQMETEKLAEVKIIGRKYLSATFTFLPISVEIVDKEGEKYHCLVLSPSKINAPMYFKPDEYLVEHGMHLRGGALIARGGAFMQAVDISHLGGKENPTNMTFGFRVAHKLKFPVGDGNKVVILSPTPTTAFSVHGREYNPIDTGERIGDYTIYTATGLFNHIERQSRKTHRDYDY